MLSTTNINYKKGSIQYFEDLEGVFIAVKDAHYTVAKTNTEYWKQIMDKDFNFILSTPTVTKTKTTTQSSKEGEPKDSDTKGVADDRK